MKGNSTHVFFPGLNGLRFIAASAVIITHVELLKQQVGLPGLWNEQEHPVFYNLGGLGVYFFFVLSGFLITYLLLNEKEITQTISVRNFYVRRMFRIWPVYYVLVVFAFFVFPHIHMLRLEYFQRYFLDHFWLKFFLYMFMLPNLCLGFFPSVPHAGHAWSIGVEEQFYLMWPWIVKYSKNIFRTILIFGFALIVLKIAVLVLCHYLPANDFLNGLRLFIAMFKVECMAIGALGACLLFYQKKSYLRFIFHPLTQIFSILLIPVLIFRLPAILQNGEHIIYSVLFLFIILNVSANDRSMIKLENRVFRFLGNISYGMYMYHMFIVVLVLRLPHVLKFRIGSAHPDIYYYTASFGGTIVFASLSYFLMERYFVRKKSAFTRVASGPEEMKEKE